MLNNSPLIMQDKHPGEMGDTNHRVTEGRDQGEGG